MAVLAVFTGCKSGDNSPVANYNDTVQYVQSFNVEVLEPLQLATVIYSEDTVNFRFIDVRSPHRFAEGHLPNAVNIPLKRIYEDKYISLLNQSKRVNIVYGEDAAQARTAVMMLSHYGYANNVAALGGYDYIKKHIIDNFGIYSNVYDDEKAIYDYAKVIAEKSGTSVQSGTNAAKPQVKIVKRKKKQEGGGGCE